MSLLGIGGPKAFAKIYGPNNGGDVGPILEVQYILVGADNVVQPGPLNTWFTVYVPFTYNDNVLSLELKVQLFLLTHTGELNLNVVFIP